MTSIALDDEQKDLFERYCHLRQKNSFLSLRNAELSEQLYLLSDISEPTGFVGRVRTWMARQERNSIQEARSSLSNRRNSCSDQLRQLKTQIQRSSGPEVFRKFHSMSQAPLNAFMEPRRRTAEIRLEELRSQQYQRTPFLVTGVVINFSQHRLSRAEERALNYGLQMSWPQYVDNRMVRVETEVMYNQLRHCEKVPRDVKLIVHALMQRVMRKWSLNFYKCVWKELEVLNKLVATGNLQFCTPCNGGHEVVVLNRADYSLRIHDWLRRYQSMFKNMGALFCHDGKCSLVEQEEHMNEQLETMRFDKQLSRAQFYRFRCRGGIPPRLVGQVDLRSNATDPSLQPRILFEGSCFAALATWLATELRSLLSTDRVVVDVADLRTRLQDSRLQTIFKVTSKQRPFPVLLHGVNPKMTFPLSVILNHISFLISTNSHTALKSATVVRLTRLCCEKVLFLFEGDVYRLEDECLPFDSPLVDVLISLAFDLVDSKACEATVPLLFFRSGPTALGILESASQAELFLKSSNNVNQCIQQRMNASGCEEFVFLDLLIDLRPLPEKPVHVIWPAKGFTGAAALRIPSVSFIPYEEKLTALREELDLCSRLNSCARDQKLAVQYLHDVYKANGYPPGDIQRAMKQVAITRQGSESKKVVVWRLPFVPAIHLSIVRGVNDINRFLRRSHVVLELSLLRTASVLPPLEPIPDILRGQAVFSLCCEKCGATSLHATDHHLAQAVVVREKRHCCDKENWKTEGPGRGKGEAELIPEVDPKRLPKLVPKLLLCSPHHKIAKAVIAAESSLKDRRKYGSVRLRFHDKPQDKTTRI